MNHYDIAVIGGGINGAGIARDAAGRGLTVLLVEQDDLASHTSSASSKLVHGGLRYLEHLEIGLVRESLKEREILLRVAPHLVRPLRFVLPYARHLRPAWIIRAGLLLYDRLGGTQPLPRTRTIALDRDAAGALLQPELKKGFVYYDACVDDARLVVANARAAARRGAVIRTRTRCEQAVRRDKRWELRLVKSDRAEDNAGSPQSVSATALVNASGAWAQSFVEDTAGLPAGGRLKLVKGSHIAVPRLYTGDHAYLLQNADRRVIFLFPYGRDLTAIGTTEVTLDRNEAVPAASVEEIAYLCAAASRWCRRSVSPRDVVNTWSGVRALFDDGAASPSAISRDYHLLMDSAGAPLVSVFGGKITTYRKLAEHVLARLQPWFPAMRKDWTAAEPLPGGDFTDFEDLCTAYQRRHPHLPGHWVRELLRRHGTEAGAVLVGVRTESDLGDSFGGGLYTREVDYLVRNEWAQTPQDVLWRRTKAGLRATEEDARRLASYLAQVQGAAGRLS